MIIKLYELHRFIYMDVLQLFGDMRAGLLSLTIEQVCSRWWALPFFLYSWCMLKDFSTTLFFSFSTYEGVIFWRKDSLWSGGPLCNGWIIPHTPSLLRLEISSPWLWLGLLRYTPEGITIEFSNMHSWGLLKASSTSKMIPMILKQLENAFMVRFY